jgi:ribonuclease III
VALCGPLGAGKTRLVQAIAEALGVDRRDVLSPTFVLMHEYRGRRPIYHIDAYRLRDDDEFLALGPEEYFDGEGLVLIEWADRVERCLPGDRIEIHIEIAGPQSRRFDVVSIGPKHAAVIGQLQRMAGLTKLPGAATFTKKECDCPSPAVTDCMMSTDPTNASEVPEMSLLEKLQQRIGYEFKDKNMLLAALTHASGAEHRLGSNERLEFLGDAILGAVVCEMLFHQFPEFLEGDLTRIKSIVVSRQTCAKISEALGMQEFLILGKGMTTHPSVPSSLLADVFESLLAAIYLDGGDPAARRFITDAMGPEIELAAEGETGNNYKSLLQQLAQREHGTTPVYQLLDEKGPDHSKCFKVAAQVGGNRYQAAWGRNKKEAEQRAARNALSQLGGESPPFPAD